MVLEQRGGNETHTLYHPGAFVPLAQLHNGQLHHLHTDHLGTPLEASNDAGDITWRVTYQTWGNVLLKEEEQITQNLRFQGQYFDQETGLHYNRFRYYDPGPGRFVSQDPIGLAGGYNLFQYVPNPIIWIDPLGLHWSQQNRKSNGQFGNKPRCDCDKKCPTLSRPYIRADIIKTVESRALKNPAGQFLDANEITPITGQYHLGHKRGHEFWREKQNAEKKCMTQAQFNDHMNNPDFYQIEDPKINMSHKHEMP